MGKIIFKRSGVEFEWTGDDESILELAEENDLDLDFGCRMGNCTACQHEVLSGEVEYPNGHTGEPDEGHQLLYNFEANDESTGIPSLLATMSALGLGFADLDTSKSTLEDIFVGLVSEEASA